MYIMFHGFLLLFYLTETTKEVKLSKKKFIILKVLKKNYIIDTVLILMPAMNSLTESLGFNSSSFTQL